MSQPHFRLLAASFLLVLLAAPNSALYLDLGGERGNNGDARELLQRFRALTSNPRFESQFRRIMGGFPQQEEPAEAAAEQEAEKPTGSEWLPEQMPGFSTFSESGLAAPSQSSGRIHAVRRAYRPKQNVQSRINVSFPKNSGWPRLVKRG